MTNGEKAAAKPQAKPKKLIDLLPEEKDIKKILTIHDFLNMDLTITAINKYIDSRGKERGVIITFTTGDKEYNLKLTQTKLTDKLEAVKHLLPVTTKITKGKRYFDFT